MDSILLNKAKELRKALLTIETDMISMQAELDSVTLTTIKLEKIKEDLEYNILHHKQPETIPIITEYRRTKKELSIVEDSIVEWHKKYKQLSSKIMEYQDRLDKIRNEYENIFHKMKNDNIILIFKPRDGDGKER